MNEPDASQTDTTGDGEMAIHLPDGVTSEDFARYVDIDNDVAISVDDTDAEIYADVQAAAADSGESDDDTPVDSSGAQRPITASFSDAIHSLHTLHVYLEANGCPDYRRFYDLAEQVYDMNRQNSIQKTIKDFFTQL